MIRSHIQACQILGVPANATKEMIKKAYKELAKKYHPDAGFTTDSSYYEKINSAYNFLQNEPEPVLIPNFPQVQRNNAPRRSQATTYQRSTASDYEAFQKKIKKQQQQKAADFEQMTKEYSKKIQKQEDDYNRAMQAINDILAARAIEAMIKANSKDDPNHK